MRMRYNAAASAYPSPGGEGTCTQERRKAEHSEQANAAWSHARGCRKNYQLVPPLDNTKSHDGKEAGRGSVCAHAATPASLPSPGPWGQLKHAPSPLSRPTGSPPPWPAPAAPPPPALR